VLIRAITLSLMICYGTGGIAEAANTWIGDSPGFRDARPNFIGPRAVSPRRGPHSVHDGPFIRRHQLFRDRFFDRHHFFRRNAHFLRRKAGFFVPAAAGALGIVSTLSDPFAGSRASFEEDKTAVTHSWRPGISTGIDEPRPDPYPTRVWDRMDLTPTTEYRPGIWQLQADAPPNRCGPGKFEILNPWYAEERCVGAP
jgi:hypothetical protein